MKRFEELTGFEQNWVIMDISMKLTEQENFYWLGLVNRLREQQERIDKAIEYINTHEYPSMHGLSEKDLCKNDLLSILQGDDKE